MVSQGAIVGIGVLGVLAVVGFLFFKNISDKEDTGTPLTRAECFAKGGRWFPDVEKCQLPGDPIPSQIIQLPPPFDKPFN